MKRRIIFRALLVIILLLIICTIALLAVLPRYLNSGTSYTAYIYKDGHLIETITLSDITDETHRIIGDYEEDYNIIQAVPGAIAIPEASCPDQICVNQGYISNSLIPITCLPNRLVIELKADDEPVDTTADAVTH